MVTQNTSNKGGFKGLDTLGDDDFPPREPFVGKIVDWDWDSSVFQNEDGSTKEQESLVLHVEPLNTVIESTDGNLLVIYRYSKRTNSLYGLAMKALEKASKEVMGSDFTWASPDELKFPMVWAGIDRKSPMFDILGKFKDSIKRHPVWAVGAPPADWKNTIPANLPALKAAAIKKAIERKAASDAGKPAVQPSMIGEAKNTDTLIDLLGQEDAIADFLVGKSDDTLGIVRELKKVPDFEKVLRDLSLYNDLVNRKIAGQLVAQGVFSLDDDNVFVKVK